jgi:hypothetical protein
VRTAWEGTDKNRTAAMMTMMMMVAIEVNEATSTTGIEESRMTTNAKRTRRKKTTRST